MRTSNADDAHTVKTSAEMQFSSRAEIMKKKYRNGSENAIVKNEKNAASINLVLVYAFLVYFLPFSWS